jgi:hypothetical protein
MLLYAHRSIFWLSLHRHCHALALGIIHILDAHKRLARTDLQHLDLQEGKNEAAGDQKTVHTTIIPLEGRFELEGGYDM